MFTCGEPEAAGGGSVTGSQGGAGGRGGWVERMNIVLSIPQRDSKEGSAGQGTSFPTLLVAPSMLGISAALSGLTH